MSETQAPSETAYSRVKDELSLFSAILLPHRSLSRKGFVTLMAIVGVIAFVCGVLFLSLGAWPVFGFLGLDVLLLYIAFRLNYRSGRMFEQVDLSTRELRITRVHPSGKAESWSFNPYWVRLVLEEREDGADVLSLTSHGRRLVFGDFLSDGEKKDFATALGNALSSQRAPAL